MLPLMRDQVQSQQLAQPDHMLRCRKIWPVAVFAAWALASATNNRSGYPAVGATCGLPGARCYFCGLKPVRVRGPEPRAMNNQPCLI